ncbi:hypothetical protein V6N13_000302 [Hibiscus sabdariffa]
MIPKGRKVAKGKTNGGIRLLRFPKMGCRKCNDDGCNPESYTGSLPKVKRRNQCRNVTRIGYRKPNRAATDFAPSCLMQNGRESIGYSIYNKDPRKQGTITIKSIFLIFSPVGILNLINFFQQDVGLAILESYSRVLESLAFSVMSRIEDVLHADSLTRASSPAPSEMSNVDAVLLRYRNSRNQVM